MLSANLTIAASLPGVHLQSRIHRTASGGLPPQHLTLPAGKPGSVDYRAGDDWANFLCVGHGIGPTDTADVYWADGVRYGILFICFLRYRIASKLFSSKFQKQN